MLAEANTEITQDDLTQIVASVFETMLGLAVLPVSSSDTAVFGIAAEPREAGTLTSAVRFAGDWEAVVLLECGARQARCFAERYLGVGGIGCEPVIAVASEPSIEADVELVVPDVMGELVNMIGGNLKSVLNCGLQLSVPVFLAPGAEGQFGGYSVWHRLGFRCPEGPFSVVVLRPDVHGH